MKTEAEFQQFYKDVLEKRLSKIEKYRKGIGQESFLYAFLPIILFVIIDAIFPVFLVFSIILYVVIILVRRSVHTNNFQTYCDDVGNLMFSPIVAFIDDRLSYSPFRGIQSQAVDISRLLEGYNEFESSNYVEGQMGETFIQFSEIDLAADRNTAFSGISGIFLIASFNKNFKGDYFIFSGHHTNPGAQFNNVNRITLEDPEFNKVFTVYGSDEVECRYILTPAMMQRMLDFSSKAESSVHFSFTRSRMFLFVETGGNYLFKPSLSNSLDYETLYRWFWYLQLAIDVVAEFQLNTRIWSKQ